MKTKTHQTAVVIIPPENLWQPIQQIRQKHDRHFRRWMPHITMIYPFRPRTQFDELAIQFQSACRLKSMKSVSSGAVNRLMMCFGCRIGLN